MAISSKSSFRRLRTVFGHIGTIGEESTGALSVQPTSGVANVRPGDTDSKPVKTSFFVEGAFTPVSEEKRVTFPLADSVLDGDVSQLAKLRGSFLRIGPNPRFDFTDKPYHVFDGDGMIHRIDFQGDGSASYENRWVQTDAFNRDQERNFSFSIMGEAASMKDTGNLAWLQHTKGPIGRANTALTYHNGRLLALFEQDVPYAVDPVSLETLGKAESFGPDPFTAHPKVCPLTGDMVYFGYVSRKKEPWCHYGVADSKGKVLRSFPVVLPASVMMHDIAITSTRSILFDYNNRYNAPSKMMSGEAKQMYEVVAGIPARFGILPRLAKSDAEIVWIDVPGAVVFHFLNAWDEGDDVVIWGAAAKSVDLDNLGGENSDISGGMMQCWRLNVATAKCVDIFTIASPPTNPGGRVAVDFAQVPTERIGTKCRYGYAAAFSGAFLINAVAKYDLVNHTTKSHVFGEGVYGGEAVFVSRGGSEEDDGWLLVFVSGDPRCESALEVVDAKTMTQVARIAVPARVPAGFHALWKPNVQ
jgi:carotenoid cleavage dioxygenase